MPAPSPSWNLSRVHGTWYAQGGGLKAGTYKVTIPARVTSVTDDSIIPAGTFASGALNTTAGAPSLDLMVPATDDPDIIERGWKVVVDVTFPDAAGEKYVIDVPVAGEVNLRAIAMTSTLPPMTANIPLGQPGGLALLNTSGQVVDADGVPVTGGGSGTVTDASLLTTGTLDPARLDTSVQTSLSLADTAAQPSDVTAAIDGLVGAAPGTLDTLAELATALGNDPNAVTTLTAAIAAKYAKPSGGIPQADLASAVQTLLTAAGTAVQPAALAAKQDTIGDYATKTAAQAAVDADAMPDGALFTIEDTSS